MSEIDSVTKESQSHRLTKSLTPTQTSANLTGEDNACPLLVEVAGRYGSGSSSIALRTVLAILKRSARVRDMIFKTDLTFRKIVEGRPVGMSVTESVIVEGTHLGHVACTTDRLSYNPLFVRNCYVCFCTPTLIGRSALILRGLYILSHVAHVNADIQGVWVGTVSVRVAVRQLGAVDGV